MSEKGKINIGVSDWSPVYKLKEAYNKAYISLKVSDFLITTIVYSMMNWEY